MSSKIMYFLISGIIWTFLLSIPVGQGKTIFHLAHFYLVDSRPVNWIAEQFSATVAQTSDERTSSTLLNEDTLERSKEHFAKMAESYQLND